MRQIARQALRFATVGVLATLLGGAVIFWARLGMGASLLAANVLGYGAGLVLTFLGSRLWVFREPGAEPAPWAGSAVGFAALFAAAFASNLAVTAGLLRTGLAYVPAQLAGMAIYSVTMFAGGRLLVFARPLREGPSDERP